MQFRRYGQERGNLTERLKPMEKANEFIFSRMNAMLSMLLTNEPGLLFSYVEALDCRVNALGVNACSHGAPHVVGALTCHYPHLAGQQQLTMRCLDVFLAELALSLDAFTSNKEIEVTNPQFHRSAMRVDYANYQALRDLVGRDEALSLYRMYVDHYVRVHDGPLMAGRGCGTLHDLRLQRIRAAESGYCGRVRIISTVEDGRVIERCENCEKVDGLKDMQFEDAEVFNTVLCDSDFPVTRLFNDSFVLTRHKTIAGGHAYCDNVIHDIRVATTVEHPDDDFIARLGTLVE
ncbi:L-2-amino-thiazoline-4-carboxylic acid hydrolase [Candidatus Bipolaricaulota bacterium]